MKKNKRKSIYLGTYLVGSHYFFGTFQTHTHVKELYVKVKQWHLWSANTTKLNGYKASSRQSAKNFHSTLLKSELSVRFDSMNQNIRI